LILTTLVAVGVFAKLQWDWHQKMLLVQSWAGEVENDKIGPVAGAVLPSSGKDFTAAEQRYLITEGVIRSSAEQTRMACLKLLVELHANDARQHLHQIVRRSNDNTIRATAIKLIAFYRKADSYKIVVPLLKDPDPMIRASAVDCLGIIRDPAFVPPLVIDVDFVEHPWIPTKPPIHAVAVLQAIRNGRIPAFDASINPIDPALRKEIESIMISGESSEERVAAARSLVNWAPKDYRLRVAEWGVWINDKGNYVTPKSLAEENPPFVHQTGDSLNQIASERLEKIEMIIKKPLVHFTVDRPMSIDFGVHISAGRPWFAYPKPDDYSFSDMRHFGRGKRPAPPDDAKKAGTGTVCRPHHWLPVADSSKLRPEDTGSLL
jgi:hypothetical protein